MTDDDNSEWSAFSKAFGNDIRHLLCKWHIHRTWKRRLQSLLPHDVDLQIEIYRALVVLMDEKNENDFKKMANNFIEIYKSKCKKFIDYFIEKYMNRPEVWAMCYRNFPHANTDTNMYVESSQ